MCNALRPVRPCNDRLHAVCTVLQLFFIVVRSLLRSVWRETHSVFATDSKATTYSVAGVCLEIEWRSATTLSSVLPRCNRM